MQEEEIGARFVVVGEKSLGKDWNWGGTHSHHTDRKREREIRVGGLEREAPGLQVHFLNYHIIFDDETSESVINVSSLY